MNHDEALRIAMRIAESLPHEVVQVVRVEHNPMANQWEVKCDEIRSSVGGRGIILWIRTNRQWVRLQKRWMELASKLRESPTQN